MKLINKFLLVSFVLIVFITQAQYTWEEVILPDSIGVKMIAFDSSGNQFIATDHGVYYTSSRAKLEFDKFSF